MQGMAARVGLRPVIGAGKLEMHALLRNTDDPPIAQLAGESEKPGHPLRGSVEKWRSVDTHLCGEEKPGHPLREVWTPTCMEYGDSVDTHSYGEKPGHPPFTGGDFCMGESLDTH